jgi:hypothetical protein
VTKCRIPQRISRERCLGVLALLNEWEQEYGTTYGAGAGLGSSGESNARIADLKDKLRNLGAVFQWNGDRYILIETVKPGSGHQMADLPSSEKN